MLEILFAQVIEALARSWREYLMRSSSGTKASTASMSEDLPAALVLWMMIASGLSSLRETAAR